MRIACVAGTRPDFVRIKPVLDALDRAGHRTELIHTGQHYDAVMSEALFDDLNLRTPDFQLNVGSGSQAKQTAKVMVAFESYVQRCRPDWIVLVGGANSALACALVGAKSGSLVAHIDAGLRSGDRSTPEEVNRAVTDRVSDLLLAPSPDCVDNLEAEGVERWRIELVGNVAIDTLLANVSRARSRPTLEELGLTREGYAVLTLHRPANVDDPSTLSGLIEAANAAAEHLPVIFPAHPRALKRLSGRDLHSKLVLIEPTGYLDFIALVDSARFVLTDSGGVQDETTVLGTPCLTLRTTTERLVTTTQGTNRLVGLDPEAIKAAVEDILSHGTEPRSPRLWEGRAGRRVAAAIAAFEHERAILSHTTIDPKGSSAMSRKCASQQEG